LEPIAREPASGRSFRLIVLYVVLGVLTVLVASVVIARGQDEHPQPAIAGGYDATAPNSCLAAAAPAAKAVDFPSTAPAQPAPAGPSFDVKQSGQFVNLSNVQGTLGGKLRLEEGAKNAPHKLTGTVSCVNGKEQEFEGTITPSNKGKGGLAGTLGGKPIAAVLRRDPPDAGAPKPRSPGDIASLYTLSPRSTCFGGGIELEGSGASYRVNARGADLGEVAYLKETGAVTGDVRCVRGGHAWLKGTAVDRNLNNVSLIPLDEATPVKPAPGAAPAPAGAKPVLTTPSGLGPAGERFTAVRKREAFGKLVAAFFIAVAVVMIVARVFGLLAVKVGQPRVMGEVVAGITLGPTILGWISPSLQATLFPTDILPAFGVAANLGLIFYMFLVGLELDPGQLKGRVTQAAAISNASVALPMMLGIAAALPLYTLLGPDKKFVAFALFMGVSMSITAFPVLARILVERRMLKRPVGALTLACAAIDDVTAWFLIALATAVAVAGTSSDVIQTIALAIAFCLVMGLLVRPLISRVSTAFDEAGRVPGVWIAVIFAGVLLSAYVTEEIGIALIFGGFIMGMVMPRNAGLTEDVTRRVEDFVVVLLLPMFFAYTGLRTNVGLLDRPVLWWITGGLIAIAIIGKLFGAMIAARVSGFDWRASTVIGTLMNTRGLTELIVLNLALEQGVISEALFAALVLMALVTTFMAGPLLNRLDPQNTYGAPIEDELAEARERSAADLPGVEVPERSILVAPRSDDALAPLLSLAEPLANSHPRREVIIARLVAPPRGASVRGGLQTENALIQQVSVELNKERHRLGEEGIVARSVAFTSTGPGRDLARLAANEDVDILLTDGYRPIVGEAIPLGDVKPVLLEAACDVGVLVAREGSAIEVGPDRPIVVPFGGAEHDWSALELAVWLASGSGAPVRLLGAAGQTEEGKSVSRLLGDASLIVQQISGVATEPLVVESSAAIVEAAEGAGLLAIGLSDRWRQEGLGETRSEIAKAAKVPVVFIRRGTRPGALAPRGDATRFTWSRAGSAPAPTNGKRQKPTEEKPAEPV
jgi:Kef-type K+ transport system membrane component KefB